MITSLHCNGRHVIGGSLLDKYAFQCSLLDVICHVFMLLCVSERKVQDSAVGQADQFLPSIHSWPWDACGDQGSRYKSKDRQGGNIKHGPHTYE